MKIATFQINNLSQKRVGLLTEANKIIDLNRCAEAYFEDQGFYNAAQRAGHFLPENLSDGLKLLENPLDPIKQCVQHYENFSKKGVDKTKNGHPLSFDLSQEQGELCCPLTEITTYRGFYAHLKHVEVGFAKRNEPVPPAWFEMPVYYKGSVSNFIGPADDIVWPSYSERLDYELELALVMGRDGKNIKAKSAFDYVFGFTILNDISARDIQKKEMSVRLGPSKGKDFCTILGPVIVTKDEFENKSPNLKMQAFVNGQKWSEGYSGDSKYSWEEMIEFSSRDEWLRSTDVLGSGTVGTGCGLEIDKWIKPGDEIEFKVEKIGSLKNTVGHRAKEP